MLLALLLAVAAPPPPPPRPPAPLAFEERAQYRISFGPLGHLGELSIMLTPSAAGTPLRLSARARGSLFGIGETEKALDAEVDARSLAPRRWTATRASGGKTVTDVAQQPSPGKVAVVRRSPGKPDDAGTMARRTPVLDPLSYLLHLRLAPEVAHTYEVLDGQALWIISTRPARQVPDGAGQALRIEGKADPVAWDGTSDKLRDSHTFTLWLASDEGRAPLRLVLPLAIGEARADLINLSRARPLPPGTGRPLVHAPVLRWLASPDRLR